MATKRDREVQELAGLFADHNDVLNRLWVMGLHPDTLKVALATSPNGTNDTTDIIARLLNANIVQPELLRAARNMDVRPDQYDWPFTKVGPGVQPPNHTNPITTGSPELPVHPTTADARRVPIAPRPAPATAPVSTGGGNVTRGGGGGGGGGGGTGGGGGGRQDTPPPPPPPISPEDWIRNNFGYMAWALDIPEIQQLINLGGQEKWTKERFQMELQATDWWQSKQDSDRLWEQLPRGEKNARLERIKVSLTNMAGQMGVKLSPARLAEMAEMGGRFDWITNPTLMQSAVAAEAQWAPGQQLEGDLSTFSTKAKQYADQYMVATNDQAAFELAQKWAAGEIDEDNVRSQFQNIAKGMFANNKEIMAIIDNGGTPKDFFQNHITTAAQLLEIAPDQVNLLTDSRFQSIVNTDDGKGGMRPMTLSELQKHVKSLDDYWTTSNAGAEVSSIVNGLARTFGKVK